MISQRAELPIVAFSVRVYQALLVAYPTKFQQEYGAYMVQVFRDCCLRTIRQSGTNGMARLWAVTLLDLVQSVVSEHSQKEIEMKKEMKPEDIRMAGWALILGGFAFAASMAAGFLGAASAWYLITGVLTFLCSPLVAVGMLGLRNRYGEKAGGFAKTMLLAGAILGPTISILGMFLQGTGELWSLIFIGPAIQFACLTLSGIVALYTKPLPRWNVLPVIAGLWFAFRFLVYAITGNWPEDNSAMSMIDVTFILLQVAALVALGYILKSDVPEETAAPA